MGKTVSSPAVDFKKMEEEETEDYKKLNEKLDLIENRIVEMRRHVQRKREEKARMMENKMNRDRQR